MNFYDEVRNEFYIPTSIKQAWSAQLQVLFEIDRICKKYDIQYFADWGTLLGTIRHGGYIPWDDDFDICMKREDYIRFRLAAKKELPKEFAIHDYETQKDHWYFIANVVNTNHISFEVEHLNKYHNFPYIACIDIFILDYVHKDKEIENERITKIKELLAMAEVHIEKNEEKAAIEIYKQVEVIAGSVDKEDAKAICQTFPFALRGDDRECSLSSYEKSVSLPFEDTYIPVPIGYHEILTKKYGNYMTAIKAKGGHDYPYYEGQKRALMENADFDLPEFKFSSDLDGNNRKVESVKTIAAECVAEIDRLSKSKETFGDLQQICIDLGTLVDRIFGEGLPIVDRLSEYCEDIFHCFSSDMAESMQAFWEKTKDIISDIQDKIITKKIAVFLLESKNSFLSYKGLYDEKVAAGYDVYLVKVPCFYKDIFGNLSPIEETIDYGVSFEYNVYDISEINVSLMGANEIYFDNLYDGENPVLSIHPDFYSKKIVNECEKLIFVQTKQFGEFYVTDERDYYNAKNCLCKPGTEFADEILVREKWIKTNYIKLLVEMTGEASFDYWNEKIKICDGINSENKISLSEFKKPTKLLIGLGIHILSEDFEVKLLEKISTIQNCLGNNKMEAILFPIEKGIWKEIDQVKTEALYEILEKNEINVITNQENISEYAAYYGSASPIAMSMICEKKAVMIAE